MTTADNIDWNLLRLLAARCERAYREATVSDALTSAQALVLSEVINGAPIIIVAFRGSKEPRDFIQDSECWQSDLVWSQNDAVAAVHHGFLEDFEAIDVAVVNAVKNALDLTPSAKILVTGHSLGGALAILCALEFSRQHLPVGLVVTFGQPRVGNAVFADIYNASLRDLTLRVVNQNDLVPRLPGVLMSYRHCGQEIFLEPSVGWTLNPTLLYKLAADAFGLWGAYRHREDVLFSEHFIAAYQRRMQLI